MSKPTKYVARYNGQIVGTRKSPRPYQFAIVAQANEGRAWDSAYNFVPDDSDRSNFAYFTEIAAASPGVTVAGRIYACDEDYIASAKANVEGGFDAYVARLRERAIANFEAQKAAGGYEPGVVGWSMSQHNAEKMAIDKSRYGLAILAIVPAEVA